MVEDLIWSDLYMQSYAVLSSSEGLKVTGRVQGSFGVFSLIASNVERKKNSEG